jgi:hypothetical protein
LAKYKHLAVKRINLADIAPAARAKELTPIQRARAERDDEIRQALNEAAALPASEAVSIDLKEGQKLPTLRAAIIRILRDEPRDLNFGVRGRTVIISKGPIPGGRGARGNSGARVAAAQ